MSRELTEIKNEDELIELIEKYLEDPLNEKKKLKQVCQELGIEDTIMLADERTINLIREYNFYSSAATPPAPYDSLIWFDTVELLSNLEPRLF